MTTLGHLYHDGFEVVGRLFEHTDSPGHVFRATGILGNHVQFIGYTPIGGRLTQPVHVTVTLQEASNYDVHRERYSR